MLTVGIDRISMDTSRYALDLASLAKARGIDSNKFYAGLGQFKMAVPPPGEDIITLAANAAEHVLKDLDKNDIGMVLFATESGMDQSKAAGIYIHHLLKLPAACRVLELKQACFAATGAIQLALPYLQMVPHKKILVIASDIARYGLNTPGESSQGAGAIAMVLSTNPSLLRFEKESGVMTEHVMDFWRPNYLHEAMVDGKYSSKIYLLMLEKTWQVYQQASGRTYEDHDYFCYHTPVPRLVEKAHQYLAKLNQIVLPETDGLQASLDYARKIGNSYTASLYISLLSLLNSKHDLSEKRIGFYSYGSGCVAEFFSGVVQAGYKENLDSGTYQNLLANRQNLSYEQYESFYQFKMVEDGSLQTVPFYQTGRFRLAQLKDHKREYELIKETKINVPPSLHVLKNQDRSIKVYAPGKLILSGEHAVVHGHPAIAIAINRYVKTSVSPESKSQVAFDLSDLSHHSHLTFQSLRHLKNKIKQKYYGFIRGDYSIRDVLQKPFELAQFAMSILAESFNLADPTGVKLHVQSDIPIGCGMGSSAATIVSVMRAMTHYLNINMSEKELYELALQAENMQHGSSSGLDLQIAIHGGCLYKHGAVVEKRSLPDVPMFLVNTGTPLSTTGQCVSSTSPFFKSKVLADDFSETTMQMDHALKLQDLQHFQKAIRANHKLLVRVGVVPDRVQKFINLMEQSGGAAKICGAGAISGERAGAVLVINPNEEVVLNTAKTFDYEVMNIVPDLRGVHAA